MSDMTTSNLIVTAADSLEAVVADVADNLGVVVTMVEPGGPVPDVVALAGRPVGQVIITCYDTAMDDDDWQVRFGGQPDELFQATDAAALVGLAARLDPDRVTIIHCGQGVSRSTAAAVIVLAALDYDPVEAVAASVAAQQASFRWRAPVAWQPNERIIKMGSTYLFGDDRLTDAVAAYRATES